MTSTDLFRPSLEPPVIVGTGFVALDVVIDERRPTQPSLWAGGTCGNVIAILSFLGWRGFPVARLNGDDASRRVLADLSRWNVRLDFATLTPTAETPIVVERIHWKAGTATHRYSWTCPNCGAWLPSYKPVLGVTASRVAEQMPTPDVFFMDRVSRGALTLARAAADRGAVVMFEPSGIGEPRLFREALALTHILKYAYDRIEHLHAYPERTAVPLEIQTLGSAGVRYRSTIARCNATQWKTVEALDVAELRDAAGAGDWCTAGLLHLLGNGGRKHLLSTTKRQLEKALMFGQALATWNCRFIGPRGGMYAVSPAEFRRQIQRILSSATLRPTPEIASPVFQALFDKLCSRCTGESP